MVATVFMRHGRWVAWCPRPHCMNAECFGIDDDGAPGGLAGGFRCRVEQGGCGLTCDAQWPPNVEDIEWLLMQRPVPATRNWEPGEDLNDLVAENIQHGIVPVSAAALEAARNGEPLGRILTVHSDGIEGGQLTSATWRHEIGAGGN